MVRVRVRLGYTMAICLVLQHQVSPPILHLSNGKTGRFKHNIGPIHTHPPLPHTYTLFLTYIIQLLPHTSSSAHTYASILLQVLEIKAKCRTGSDNFVTCMCKALGGCYGDRPVALGGVFQIVSGKAHLHVMV